MCLTQTCSLPDRAAGATWRGGLEPVAGLILSCLFVSQWAEIPLAEVLFQLAQAVHRRQIHKTVQEVPVLSPRVAHAMSQVSVEIIQTLTH